MQGISLSQKKEEKLASSLKAVGTLQLSDSEKFCHGPYCCEICMRGNIHVSLFHIIAVSNHIKLIS
jgi:hypothetical protein